MSSISRLDSSFTSIEKLISAIDSFPAVYSILDLPTNMLYGNSVPEAFQLADSKRFDSAGTLRIALGVGQVFAGLSIAASKSLMSPSQNEEEATDNFEYVKHGITNIARGALYRYSGSLIPLTSLAGLAYDLTGIRARYPSESSAEEDPIKVSLSNNLSLIFSICTFLKTIDYWASSLFKSKSSTLES